MAGLQFIFNFLYIVVLVSKFRVTRILSRKPISFSTLAIFSLFVVFTTSGIFDQIAFAEESSEEFILGPATNALTTFFNELASSAPKIIAAIILLIIGWIVGTIIGKVITKFARVILEKINKDESEEDLKKFTSSQNLSRLIGTVLKWFVFLFFIIAAVNALEFEQLSIAMTNLWLWVPNLIAFIVIVLVGMLAANFAGKWVDKECTERNYGYCNLLSLGIKAIIYIIVIPIAVTQLGVGEEIISILISALSWGIAVGIGAAVAVGLGFALKDMLPGIINSQSKKSDVLTIGQKVQIGEYKGTITAVELLHVILANEDNESVVIPTKDLSTKTIRIFGKS